MNNPSISVILPVFNGERFLAEAIDSIIGQTFDDFELIALDDGSRDASPTILRRYERQDRRIRVVPLRENQGLCHACNRGLALARAPFVARMDQDDIAVPHRFELQINRLRDDRGLWVLGMRAQFIDEAGQELGRVWPPLLSPDGLSAALEKWNNVSHPSVLLRREPILELGGYRPAYEYADDYDLWLRVLERGRIENLPNIGVLYRVHPQSITQSRTIRQNLSAELAKATHRLRLAGKDDPTNRLTAPPHLDDPLLDTIIPAIPLHRLRTARDLPAQFASDPLGS